MQRGEPPRAIGLGRLRQERAHAVLAAVIAHAHPVLVLPAVAEQLVRRLVLRIDQQARPGQHDALAGELP